MPRCEFQAKFIVLLVFNVFAAFFIPAHAPAQQGKLIESVDVQGNRRLTDKEILRHIKTRLGERFHEQRVREDLQSLLNLDEFEKSRTRVITEPGIRGGVNVIFEIREMPLVIEIKFEGLRYATKEELLAELNEQKAKIPANNPYQPEKFRKAWKVITQYLVEKLGFIDAKVSVAEESVSATTIKISFIIDELPNDDEEDCCEK